MDEKYFVHEIRIGEVTQKGIVICDKWDDALQTYHAYLSAYAYGHDNGTNYVQAMITDLNGIVYKPETWIRQPAQEATA